MTNINLEPGPWTLAALIADTDDGILMATNRSWSIDDRRYNFQFGTEAGWEIKRGKRGRLLKNCTYTGITPQFWNQCDAVCDDWEIWGTPNCGKGQPSQSMRTAQGADRALALARLSPEDDRMPTLAPPAEPKALAGFVPATAACTPEERAAAVGAVMQAARARDLTSAGALTTAASALAVANTLGVFAYHPDTYANFTCTVRAPDASGWVDRHRRDWRALDVLGLGTTAIRKAEGSRAPGEVPPGRYTVVLEPAAVAELVAFLAWLGLGAQSEQEGRSFLSGRMGERITGAGVTVVDDAFDPRTFGRPFDFEGTPRRRMTLIEDGVARAVVHDRRTGLAAGPPGPGQATA